MASGKETWRFYCMRARGQSNLRVARKTDKKLKIRNLFTKNRNANRKTYIVQVETASESRLSAGSRVIGALARCLPPTRVVVKFGVVQGLSEAARCACRQCRAGKLAGRDREINFPGWNPRGVPKNGLGPVFSRAGERGPPPLNRRVSCQKNGNLPDI